MTWNINSTAKYESSTINMWMNEDYIETLDVKSIIKSVKIPYRYNGGHTGTDKYGANGLPCKVFLLSGNEIGYAGRITGLSSMDGTKLNYFESGDASSADNKRIAYLNSVSYVWWLRSLPTEYNSVVWCVPKNGGTLNYFNPTDSQKVVRPAFILPFDTQVDFQGNIVI